MSRVKSFAAGLGLAALLSSAAAFAADPESCKAVRFADVGWTDITATTATASVILEALGYEPDVQVLSVPVTYTSLKNKDIDVFLGNWMPTMEADIKPYLEDKIGRDDRRPISRARNTRSPCRSIPMTPASRISPTSPSSRTSSTARSTASRPAMTATG